jgi:hypothetical protein
VTTPSAGRSFAGVRDLVDVTEAALGGRPRLSAVDRLRGGSKKGVYRLAFDDQSSVVAYVWNETENFWPAPDDASAQNADRADPFSDASGADLFQASHACLQAIGVPVPRVYAIDRSKQRYPADVAFVEDVRGGSLEDKLDREPDVARTVLTRLAEALAAMEQYQSLAIGKVALVRDDAPERRSCPQIVLDRARAQLAWAAKRVPRLSDVRDELHAELSQLAGLPGRRSHALVHGELGPDHVLINGQGDPVVIDIEGLMYFDVEWEHAFLRLRFGDHYGRLRPVHLDEDRLRLYSLALHISLVAGPLRLLDGDFPDRESMLAIVEHNIRAALAFAK